MREGKSGSSVRHITCSVKCLLYPYSLLESILVISVVINCRRHPEKLAGASQDSL